MSVRYVRTTVVGDGIRVVVVVTCKPTTRRVSDSFHNCTQFLLLSRKSANAVFFFIQLSEKFKGSHSKSHEQFHVIDRNYLGDTTIAMCKLPEVNERLLRLHHVTG